MTEVEPAAALREQAVERIKKRREFYAHLVVYVLVNGFLVVIWAMTTRPGFFWPVFLLFGWGIGIAMHAWDVYLTPPITEADIDREVDRLQRR